MYLDHLLHCLLLSFFPSSCLVSSSNATTLVDVCLFVPERNIKLNILPQRPESSIGPWASYDKAATISLSTVYGQPGKLRRETG